MVCVIISLNTQPLSSTLQGRHYYFLSHFHCENSWSLYNLAKFIQFLGSRTVCHHGLTLKPVLLNNHATLSNLELVSIQNMVSFL